MYSQPSLMSHICEMWWSNCNVYALLKTINRKYLVPDRKPIVIGMKYYNLLALCELILPCVKHMFQQTNMNFCSHDYWICI